MFMDIKGLANVMLLCGLYRAKIPFDVSYKPETQKDEASIQLTVYINPKTTVNYNLEIPN
jgi:hypothetical protein